MIRLTLGQRVQALTIIAILPIAAILAYNIAALRHEREAEIHAEALQIGNLATLEMQRIFSGAEGLLSAVAASRIVRAREREQCAAYLDDIALRSNQLLGLSAVEPHGESRCPSTSSFAPPAVTTSDAQPFIVGEFSRTSDGRPYLPLQAAIRGPNGDIDGYVVGAMSLDWLREVIRQHTFPNNDSLTIADRQGVIIAREPFSDRFVGTRIPAAFRNLVRTEKPGSLELTSQDGSRRVLGYFPAVPSVSEVYVSAGVDKVQAMRPIEDATRRSVVVVAIGALVAFLAATAVGRTMIRAPVRRLDRTIRAWRGGDDAARTNMKGAQGEIEAIGFAIDRFMDELAVARVERGKHDEQRDLLLGEMEHRVKNVLSTVQSIASQTLRKGSTDPVAFATFNERLVAMANAYRLLQADHWRESGIHDVLSEAIKPFDRTPACFELAGPNLRISSKAAWAIAMAVHELCTNACKYGALSTAGAVDIDWRLVDGDFQLRWRERSGPRISPPQRFGFGSRMVERVLRGELGAEIAMEFNPEGFVCTVTAPPGRLNESRDKRRL